MSIKDEAKKLISDFKGALGKIAKSRDAIDATHAKIDQTEISVRAMQPGPEQIRAITLVSQMRERLAPLENETQLVEEKTRPVFDALEKIKDTFGLGIPILLPIALVAGVMLAAGYLWDKVHNETQRIQVDAEKVQLLATGKLTAEQYVDITKQNAGDGGIFGNLKKLVPLVAVAIIAPTILSAVRR